MKNFPSKNWIIPLGSFIWLIFLLCFYFIFHKPFSSFQFFSILRAISNFLVALWVLSLAGALGTLLIKTPEAYPHTKLALQAAVGIGVLSWVILVYGSIIGISTALGWGLLFVLTIGLWKQMIAWLKRVTGLAVLLKSGSLFGYVMFPLFGIIFLFTWINAQAPPIKFDALVYHLAIPLNYLLVGRIVYIPENIFWGMPETGEMLYLWLISLTSMEAASIFGWFVGLLSIIGLVCFTRDRLGEKAGWVAGAVLLLGYTLASSLSWGYIDWFTILFGFCFLVFFEIWMINQDTYDLIWAGLFGGFALGTKYTSGALLIIGIVIICFNGWIKNKLGMGAIQQEAGGRALSLKSPLRSIFFDLIIFSFSALISSLPWWIKNFLATGHLFYPFIQPAGAMTALRLNLYTSLPIWGDWMTPILLPFVAPVMGADGTAGFNATIGPLLVILPPFAWLGFRTKSDNEKSSLITASLISILGWIIWGLSSRLSGLLIQSRLYFCIFPAIAFLAAHGFFNLKILNLPKLRIQFIFAGVICFLLCLNALTIGIETINSNSVRYLVGLESRESYLKHNLGLYAEVMTQVRKLTNDQKIIMLWEPRSLYCLPLCSPDETLDKWLSILSNKEVISEPQIAINEWRSNGYTHLLINQTGLEFIKSQNNSYPPEAWTLLDTILGKLILIDEFGGFYSFYKIP